MTKIQTTNNVIITLYSDDLRLSAQVVEENGNVFVDFYRDEVLLDSRKVTEQSLKYAEDMAENYVLGVLSIDPDTWRLNGV